jgi:hypothetical protein
VHLVDIILDNRASCKFIEASESENVIFCRPLEESLYDVSLFSTRSGEFIHNYIQESAGDYLVTNVTLDNGTIYEGVRFKVVVVEEGVELPYSTINLKSLGAPSATDVITPSVQLLEEEHNLTIESVDEEEDDFSVLYDIPETVDNTKIVKKVKALETKLISEQQKLDQEKLKLSNERTILEADRKLQKTLEDYKSELLTEYYLVGERQKELLNTRIETTVGDLSTSLQEQFDSQQINVNKYLDEISAANLESLKSSQTTQINKVRDDIKNLLSEHLDTNTQSTEKQLLEHTAELEKLLTQKITLELESHKRNLNKEINSVTSAVEKLVEEKLKAGVEDTDKLLVSRSGDLRTQFSEDVNSKLNEYKDSLFEEFKNFSHSTASDLFLTKTDELNQALETLISEHKESLNKTIDQKLSEVTASVNTFTTDLEGKLPQLDEAIKDVNKRIQNLVIEKRNVQLLVDDAKKYTDTKVAQVSEEVMNYARRILDLGGGGGSVAVQYANGGTMNGTLNVTGQYLSGGIDISTLFGNGGGNTSTAQSIYVSGGAIGSIQPLSGSNTASGYYSNIGGGQSNSASGACSFVGGGDTNCTTNALAVVAGGNHNCAIGGSSFVGGGRLNTASAQYATVAGGNQNCSIGYAASVVGGQSNTADCDYSIVAGGASNCSQGGYASIVGGQGNIVVGDYTSIINGNFNRICNQANTSSIINSNGSCITASGDSTGNYYSVIIGGANNCTTASGYQSGICDLIVLGSNSCITSSGDYASVAHNIVTGHSNVIKNGASYSGITHSIVAGGQDNVICSKTGSSQYITLNYTTIVGGRSNMISICNSCTSADYATIVGGQNNNITASGFCTSLANTAIYSGLSNNIIAGSSGSSGAGSNVDLSRIIGGIFNIICTNTASGLYNSINNSAIYGGESNNISTVTGDYSSVNSSNITGGAYNGLTAESAGLVDHSSIVNGKYNTISASGRYGTTLDSIILNGGCNKINTTSSCYGATANTIRSLITTGCCNTILTCSGNYSSSLIDSSYIGGGTCNLMCALGNCTNSSSIVNGGYTCILNSNINSGYKNKIFTTFSGNYDGDTVTGNSNSGGIIGVSINGGICNCISNTLLTQNVYSGLSASSINSGTCNVIINASNSIIVGGYNNRINDNSNYSYIAAGSGNTVNGVSNTFLLGSNLIGSVPNYTYVNNICSIGNVATTTITATTATATTLRINTAPRTFTNPVTASGTFVVVNINGANKALQLWDYSS